MRKNKSTWMWIAVVAVLLVGLFLYPKLTAPKNSNTANAKGAPCLVPNLPLSQHIHPELTILVNGVKEMLPQNVGLLDCERALHTHDDTGVIHVESQDKREYTLGDFFSVWKKSIEREGYTVLVTADGEPVSDPAGLKFKDGQKILISYTKTTNPSTPFRAGN